VNFQGLEFVIAAAVVAGAAAAADVWYVSPTGDDAADGGRERPFATLERARDAARDAADVDPARPRRIVVLPGDHHLDATLTLDARDSGLAIEAAPGARPTLLGGPRLAGWRIESNGWWSHDLPAGGTNGWDLRALVVGDRLAERSRWPAEGVLRHRAQFPVRWLSSVGGGWERPPTTAERSTMPVDPTDLPPGFEPRNAEVRVYHMWDESLVGVAGWEAASGTLTLSPPPRSPPGAFGVKKYVVFNLREGMTRPGQWYHDRAAGRLFYWPRPDETPGGVRLVAPRLGTLVRVAGAETSPARRISLRGLAFAATTTPLTPSGFGANAFAGAIELRHAHECAIEDVHVFGVAGQAIVALRVETLTVSRCVLRDVGACGIRAEGAASRIEDNRVMRVGRLYPSAVAISVSHTPSNGRTNGFQVARNEIADAPYTGVIGGGHGHVFERNHISRVMLELQDGGAIYGGMRGCVLRENVVQDVVKMGEGYGVSAYYLDEGARDCVVERNVSANVERPVHLHMASRIVLRDNVFIAASNLTLSFPRSAWVTAANNLVVAPGGVAVAHPNAIRVWTNNTLFLGTPTGMVVAAELPPATPPPRRAAPFEAPAVTAPPAVDGRIAPDEWPGTWIGLDRDPAGWMAPGAPAFVRFAWDERHLYAAIQVAAFDAGGIRTGRVWGVDDGVELRLDGGGGVRVARVFAGGAVLFDPVPADGVQSVRCAALVFGKDRGGWRAEWAIPFEALGGRPDPGQPLRIGVAVYRSEDDTWRTLHGGPAAGDGDAPPDLLLLKP